MQYRGAQLGLFVSLAAGCGKHPPSEQPASPPGAAATATATASSGATVACSFDRGLTGKLGPAHVFVQLHRAGDELSGSYFYEKIGAELILKGTVTGASFSLVERSGGKITGKLDGACAAGGALAGTWSSPEGDEKLLFSFSVPERIEVGTRRLAFTARSKDADGLGDCAFKRETPVVLGAAGATVERHMAAAIERAARGISDPKDEQAAHLCHGTDEEGRLAFFSGGFSLASQDANLLVFLFSASMNAVPSAHPSNYVGATVLDLDVATGDAVTAADVVTDEKRVVALAQTCSDGPMALAESEPALLFLPRGIRVVGTSYPHALAVATFQGPVVSYGALLRDGLLKAGSPIARVWANQKPAAPGASPCEARWRLE